MRLLVIYRRRWWLFYLPVILCTVLALWWSSTHWMVLPPTKIVIAGGSPQGSYLRLAQRYAEQLEQRGMNVEVVYSDSPKGALDRLETPADAASIGFAHGTYANPQTTAQALAVIGQEPVWIFSGSGGPVHLHQSAGARLAAGPLSSSSYMAAKVILEHAGVAFSHVQLDPANDMAAANALLDGKVDLVFQAAGEDAQAIQVLTRSRKVQLLGVEHAGALAAQERYLQLLLPQGSIELRGDIPPRDLTMMRLQTHLIVRPDVHPALQRALLDAAQQIHEFPTFLQRHGQFPSFRGGDFTLTPTAKAYRLGARPWMETLLPYRKAQYAELLAYAVVPILTLALIMLVWIPRLFDWRISATLNHFYGELKFLEKEMEEVAINNPMALKGLLERLDNIERRIVEMDLPDTFSKRWYTLREHLSAARDRLLKLRSR